MRKRGGQKEKKTMNYILQVDTSIRFKESPVLYSEYVLPIFLVFIFSFLLEMIKMVDGNPGF